MSAARERGAFYWTLAGRTCERQGVHRALWGLSLLSLCACVGDDQARLSARGTGADAGTSVIADSVALASVAKSAAPWWVAPDPVGQQYPAYGLALHHMANVYEEPRKESRVLGYLRRGARFRGSEEVTREGCPKGWFEVLGGGFVCHGEGVLVDSKPPSYGDPPGLPAISDALPYRYMKTTTKDVPQYMRLPTPEEEQAVKVAFASSVPVGDAGVTSLGGLTPALALLVRSRMQPGFYVSIDREVRDEASGRVFFRTVRGGYIRAELLTDAKQPKGVGVALGGRLQLPIAFVYRAGAPTLRLDPVSGEAIKAGPDLPVQSAHQLTGQSLLKNGRRYFVTADGLLLRDSAIRIIDRVPRPKHTGKSERWIRVDLDRQTLTAYDGERPVFATLVSSGLNDHATPTGIYRLHAKHVATTMADDMASGDGAYSIEDVPWTMYFLGGYALHAAFWHDKFGNQRSHGCVNLAPRDARWLFFWSAPDLPSGWHGAIAKIGKGAVVTLDSGSVYAIEQGS